MKKNHSQSTDTNQMYARIDPLSRDLYQPVNFVRHDRRTTILVDPNFIVITPNDYDHVRGIFTEQKLQGLLSRDRRIERGGLYFFDISGEPQERIEMLGLTTPESFPRTEEESVSKRTDSPAITKPEELKQYLQRERFWKSMRRRCKL